MSAGPARVLLYGLGITNAAVASALVERGRTVIVADDRVDDAKVALAAGLGVELVSPGPTRLMALVASVDAVIPAPGLPESHPVFGSAAAASTPIMSEFDLAREWDDRPLLSITGTNGKTTVTMLVTAMMNESGRRAVAVGNTDVPLVAAIADPDIDVFVVESSSFRLAHTQRFTPLAAAWLNFAEDHLDVHADLAAYEAAKARQWADLAPTDTAVANADDPVVSSHVGEGAGRFVTFGLSPDAALPGIEHFTCIDGDLVAPDGSVIIAAADMFRALPHDISNALAAAAVALAGGATLAGVRAALEGFEGLAHRVELVASVGGVAWYDDSKATAPHAVVAAVTGFDSVVLIAGGRNKGLDLSTLGAVRDHVRAVVGIGEAGPEVVAAFAGLPSALADSMSAAVEAAAAMASTGDTVLLSPGCASFDWYANYGERGDHFASLVRELAGASS